jgi:uncharacterized membrane protein YgdD (TMEM256/DUF423 family)
MTGSRYSDNHSAYLVFRALALLIVAAVPLRAYADPGSGWMLWQIGGAAFLGFIYQVRKLVTRLRKRK